MKKKRSKESRERTAEALRRYHANKTEAQRKRVCRAMSKARLECYENMSDEEHKALCEKRAKQIKKHYASAAGKRTKKKLSKIVKAYKASLSEEQRQHSLNCMFEGLNRFRASLTPEDRKEMFRNRKGIRTNRGFVNYEEVVVPRVNDYCGVLTEDQLETV